MSCPDNSCHVGFVIQRCCASWCVAYSKHICTTINIFSRSMTCCVGAKATLVLASYNTAMHGGNNIAILAFPARKSAVYPNKPNNARHGGNNTHLMMQADLAVNAPYLARHTVVHVWQQPSTFSVHFPDPSCMRATQASHAGVLMEPTSSFCMLSWSVFAGSGVCQGSSLCSVHKHRHMEYSLKSVSSFCMLSCNVPLQGVEFVRGEAYARFTRIIFDTAPTDLSWAT